MKKALNIILSVVISIILTFIVAYITGWYRFEDEFTRSVFMRLTGFFFIIEGLSLCIYTYILSKKTR